MKKFYILFLLHFITINVIMSSEIMNEEIKCMDILFYYSCVLIACFIYCPQISFHC